MAVGVIGAGPALAAPIKIVAPDKVYPTVNTVMAFLGTDPVSGDTRTMSVSNLPEGTGGCHDAPSAHYATAHCPGIDLSLNTGAAGLLRIPGNTVVNDNGIDKIIAASGAVITNATDDSGGDSHLFDVDGTLVQLNKTLGVLKFVPANDYEEKQTTDASLPQLAVEAISGANTKIHSTHTVYLKVEGSNAGPTLTAPSGSLDATVGTTGDYIGDATVTDPEMCDLTICGSPYTNPGLAEPDDQMVLVAWLPASSCGSFSLPGSTFTSVGSATRTSVDALLKYPSGLDYFPSQATAVESSIDPAALSLNLSGQASTGNPTTVFAGVATLTNVRYALGHLEYDAPATPGTCHLDFTVSDLGNNGMPTSYVGSPVGGNSELPEPGYEVPNAKGDNASITFAVHDTHPHVTVEQTSPTAPGVDPTHTHADFTVTFDQPVESFDQTDVDLSASSAGGATANVVAVTPGSVYTISAIAAADGNIIAKVDAGKVYAQGHDSDSNFANAASTSTDNTIRWDATRPTVTMNQASGQADPTSSSTIGFTATFSEPVSGFDGGDLDLSASTASGTLVASVSGGPTVYTVKVSGMTGSGNVVVSVPDNAAQDGAVNQSHASTSTDNTVAWILPPTITAAVTSAHPKTTAGWYRSPVTVTFTCTPTGAPLSDSCPSPVALSNNVKAASVTRTIHATDGGVGTITVSPINIDQTPPRVTVAGVRSGHHYNAPAPKPHCVGHDALSRIARCVLHQSSHGSIVNYTATATDKAGNSAHTHGHYLRSTFFVVKAPFAHGRFVVHVGRHYTVEAYVSGHQAPRYGQHKLKRTGHNKWTIKILITSRMRHIKNWNLGVQSHGKRHLIPIRVLH